MANIWFTHTITRLTKLMPFVNLRIGTSAFECELKLLLQRPLFPVPKILWTLNILGWWLIMKRPCPQSHVTLWYCSHVTNKRRYISPFARSMDLIFCRVVIQDMGTSLTSHVTHWILVHVTDQKRYISTLTRPMDPSQLSRMMKNYEGTPPTKSSDTSIVRSRGKSEISLSFFRVVTKMRSSYPTCHVTPWSHHHVLTIQ